MRNLDTPWVGVYSGRKVPLLNPRPEDIDLGDIAHALARINRFGGHTDVPLSVAQHSVLVSRLAARDGAIAAKWGLLHDACEAYLGDMSSPLKGLDLFYQALEARWQGAILARFDLALSGFASVAVRYRDLEALIAERRDNGPHGYTDAEFCGVEDIGWVTDWRIEPWGYERAEREFLRRAEELRIV